MERNYLLLARGESLAEARVVAISAERAVVERFAAALVGEDAEPDKQEPRGETRTTLRAVPAGDGE